jgi:hypothetical protein
MEDIQLIKDIFQEFDHETEFQLEYLLVLPHGPYNRSKEIKISFSPDGIKTGQWTPETNGSKGMVYYTVRSKTHDAKCSQESYDTLKNLFDGAVQMSESMGFKINNQSRIETLVTQPGSFFVSFTKD